MRRSEARRKRVECRKSRAYDPDHMRPGIHSVWLAVGLAGALAAAGFAFTLEAKQSRSTSGSTASTHRALVDEYCVSCHDEDKKKGGLSLEAIAALDVARHPDVWEKVVGSFALVRCRQSERSGLTTAHATR